MTTRKQAKEFVEKAFATEIEAKAALIVIHRVVRSMDSDGTLKDFQTQREAMDKLIKFAEAHPLPPNLERLL